MTIFKVQMLVNDWFEDVVGYSYKSNAMEKAIQLQEEGHEVRVVKETTLYEYVGGETYEHLSAGL